jgi:hypothetical protein
VGQPPALETTARNFNRDWLQGNVASLCRYLDDGQNGDLYRWWTVFQGDREILLVSGGNNDAGIAVTVINSDGARARVQITFTVSDKPALVLLQCWRRQADHWCFDPTATLQLLDQQVP